jgi:NAD(P)-dependent dehydrogenase (short-subunit alcohol dehydrogenase family)
MNDFKGKVAVITGAASGIGQALAEYGVRLRMKVVLADVEAEALAKTEAEMRSAGATVLAVRTDVSQAEDVEALAQKTLEAFGAVHLLCNNAGVATSGTVAWESSLTDWEWVLGVNLWGVIHSLRTFVPIMLAQDTECHIVNTASLSGLISFPRGSVYAVTKHGVVTLSETLHHELAERGGNVKVSVLCPGLVRTRIVDCGRNRPERLPGAPMGPVEAAGRETLRQQMQTAMPPAQVADAVFQAIRDERFYILTHPEGKDWIRTRLDDILQQRNPTPPG